MAQSRRPLFRESAFKQYMQKREKDSMPRLISPPIFLFSWILLCLLVAAAFLAWWGEVPIFASGQGIMLAQTHQQGQLRQQTQNTATQSSTLTNNDGIEALVLLPAAYSTQIRVGQSASVQLGATGPSYSGQIETVDSQVVSPGAMPVQYTQSGLALLLTQPSILVRVRLSSIAPHSAGSLVQARVLVQTRRAISLLPGFDQLVKG